MALARDWLDDDGDDTEPASIASRPVMCRWGGCAAPALGESGLCESHEPAQKALRAKAAAMGPASHPFPPGVYRFLGELGDRSAAWRRRAACRGMTDTMFPEVGRRLPSSRAYADALAICATCPVVDPCRQAGSREHDGTWGGLTPPQRFPKRRP